MSTQVLELAGCRLHWSAHGAGDPILFLQGTGVHGEGWRPQLDEFAREFRCLSFDNRGMGQSQPVGGRLTIERMAQDALALLDAAGARNAHVVGHSLGGMVAIALALLAPTRVRSLALLCTFADGHAPARSARMFWLGLRSRIGSARMRRLAFLEILLPPALLAGVDRDALAAQLAPLFGHDLALQPPIVMAQIRAFRRCDFSARLGELARIPTLVVAAAHDVITPPPIGRDLAAAIPGARYVELADAGHGAPITHPAEINALLREHFAAAANTISAPGPLSGGRS
ncbi:MAG: alpha/beta fold hydrolase [Planctomycetes bacterium]|nr:alpha/beta fold hydrolase [Planctomycetota bacterium]